ncbi:MAG: adenylyltransferase/cytidyltransferase family protein, partial [candidate division Zixibacteria bacterium]|nr:adenylyltransferase/cytidyltransferase family protein [candidate division Zixibacteria bacterium]
MGIIVTQNQMVRIRLSLRKRGKIVIFTNGCFDIIHRGHVEYLAEAKKLGDVLIIGLNSDSSVRRLKGSGRPIVKMPDRAIILS